MNKRKCSEKVLVVMRYTFIVLTVAALVYSALTFEGKPAEWEGIASLTIALVLFFLPTILSRHTKIKIPAIFQIFFLLFIFASLYLGEMHGYYYRFSWWDSMLHSTSGVMLAYIGFLLIIALNRNKSLHLNLNPFFLALFSFCFAMAMGVLWELFEYFVDELFGTNMQKAKALCDEVCDSRLGLIDTMKDFIKNTAGALAVSLIGYYYCKKKMVKDNRFWRLKDQFIEDNPGLFNKD